MSFGDVRKLDMPDSFSKGGTLLMSLCCQSRSSIKATPSLEAMEFALQSLLMETQLCQHILRLVYLCVWVFFGWGLHYRIFNSFWVSKPLQNPLKASEVTAFSLPLSLIHVTSDMTLEILPSYLFSLPGLISAWAEVGKKLPVHSCVCHFPMTGSEKEHVLRETILDQPEDILWNNVSLNFHSCVCLVHVHMEFSGRNIY